MLELQSSRRIWKCGDKWINGEQVDTGEGCRQEIFKSDKEKYRSGKFKVLNFKDGPGGNRNDPHVCPYRVGSEFHHYKKLNKFAMKISAENMPCSVCGTRYNSNVHVVCPTCFRKQCRKCKNLQHWIINGPLNQCFACGHDRLDLVQVYYAHYKTIGKAEEITPEIKIK